MQLHNFLPIQPFYIFFFSTKNKNKIKFPFHSQIYFYSQVLSLVFIQFLTPTFYITLSFTKVHFQSFLFTLIKTIIHLNLPLSMVWDCPFQIQFSRLCFWYLERPSPIEMIIHTYIIMIIRFLFCLYLTNLLLNIIKFVFSKYFVII